jgi:hypothetical protein
MNCPSSSDSSLSSDEFEMFWKWLTLYSSDLSSGIALKAKQADTIKVIRVFNTLNLFNTTNNKRRGSIFNSFPRSWHCQHPDKISYQELKDGMLLLTPLQYSKFHRLVVALRVQEAANKQKEKEEEIQQVKQEKKQKQKEKALSSRDNRAKFCKTALVHPSLYNYNDLTFSVAKRERKNVYHLTTKKKLTTGSLPHKPKHLFRKFINLVWNSFSRSWFSTATGGGRVQASSNSYDARVLAFSNSDEQDDFTSRLTMAKRSIFHDKVCSNEAMSGYRLNQRRESIIESLVSFDFSDDDDIEEFIYTAMAL